MKNMKNHKNENLKKLPCFGKLEPEEKPTPVLQAEAIKAAEHQRHASPGQYRRAEAEELRQEVQEGGKAGDDMSVWELLRTSSLRKQVLVGIVIKIGVQVFARNSGAPFGPQNFRRAIL